MTNAVKQRKSPKIQLAADSNVNNYPNKIYAKSCESVDFSANVKSGEGGIRISSNFPDKTAYFETGGALIEVQNAWDNLTPSQKEAILRIVREGL